MNETRIAVAEARALPAVTPDRHVPIKPEKIRKILELARCAPTAMPSPAPWKVHLLERQQRAALTRALHGLVHSVSPMPRLSAGMHDYTSFPEEWRSAWLVAALSQDQKYDLADKVHPDKHRLLAWYRCCLSFLNAPGHLLLTQKPCAKNRSFIEHGSFIKNIKWAAEMNGLRVATMGLTPLDQLVRAIAGIDESEHLVCAVALGRH